MYRKTRFYHDETVRGITLEGKKVTGLYRGVRASFGVLIFGITDGSEDPPALHSVLALSLEHVQKTPKALKHIVVHHLKAGDPCTGITKDGTKIVGAYMNAEGQNIWIRGWPAGANKLAPKQAYKVIKDTLRKTS